MTALTLPQGTIGVRDTHPRGDAPGATIVLVHGVLVDGRLWDPVVERLRARHRLVALDLPLGAHRTPMPEGADLTPPGLAALIAAALDALDLRDVVLVGNDTGGGLAQITAARHPERLAALALTNCDTYERFPPPLLRPLVLAARAGIGVRWAPSGRSRATSRWRARRRSTTASQRRPSTRAPCTSTSVAPGWPPCGWVSRT